MTDTGPVPGEGLPENAGAEAAQQPHSDLPGDAAGVPSAQHATGHHWSTDAFLAPATPVYDYGPPQVVGRPGPGGGGEEEDDLLLMPGPQGSWGDPQPYAQQPVPQPPFAEDLMAPPPLPYPLPVHDVPQQPADLMPPVQEPFAPEPYPQPPVVLEPVAMGPLVVGPAPEAVPQPEMPQQPEMAQAPEMPQQPEMVQDPAAAAMPPAEPVAAAEPLPPQAPGAAETMAVRLPAPATSPEGGPGQGAPARRPLNLGPPVAPGAEPRPEATGGVSVRSLADRGPTPPPAPVLPVPPAVVPEPEPEPQPSAEPPAASAEEEPATVPEYPAAPAEAIATIPAQQTGEAPVAGGPWGQAAGTGAPAGESAEPVGVAPMVDAPQPVPAEAVAPAVEEAPAEPAPVAEAATDAPAAEPEAAPAVAEEPAAPEAEAVAEPEPEPGPAQAVVAVEEPPAPAVAEEPEPTPEAVAAEEPAQPEEPAEAVQDERPAEPVAAEQPAPAGESAPAGEPEPESAPEPEPVAARQPGPAFAGYEPAVRDAVHRVIRERRDIRNGFRPDPIPPEVLLRVLEAAHTAPSVGHSQPWDFVVIRSDKTREKMHELAMRQRDAYANSLPKARAKQFRELKIEAILDTPVNIVVTADPTRGGRHTLGRHTQPQMAPYSSALAVENLWLAARAEGLGVGWVSFFDEREMVRELGLPEHLEVVAYLCVGYVDEFPEEPELVQAGWSKRRPLSWVVHEEEYGNRALPGEDPHDLLDETLRGIRPLDAKALGEAWERQKRMTKPSGALGMLEIISAQLSGLSRQCPPPIPEPAAVAIFAGDHGVHAQGVTAWPQEVTAQMVANFLGGGAVCNAFANQVGAEVCVVDVGVAAELPTTPGLLPRKVRMGTDDFTTGPAMSREDVLRAIEVGIETARDLVAAGNKVLLTGEMGIANTTASAALIAVFTGADPAEVTGRGTGINDEMHARKIDVVRRALELHQPDPADPIGVLAASAAWSTPPSSDSCSAAPRCARR